MRRVAIVDYGVGNLLSLQRSLNYSKIKNIITSDHKQIEKSSHLILPGVGAFGSAINLLKKKKLDLVIKEFSIKEKPILGICLGMQLLFNKSYEFGQWKGLNLIEGKVKKINIKKFNLPIVGWYNLQVKKKKNLLNVFNNKSVYLLHTYECIPLEKNAIIGHYNLDKYKITCAVQKKNIVGMQFHPEKSSYDGIKMLKNFYNS
jgi:imidazole glycerol-phosphate synthase subunit HisH